MLKNILKIDGISPLDKKQQKSIRGGNLCNNYSGPICFSDDIPWCGSCQDYWTLPIYLHACVLADADCLEFQP